MLTLYIGGMMPEQANLHSKRRRLLCDLLAEPDDVLKTTVGLATQPSLMRSLVGDILSLDSWNSLSVVSANAAGHDSPFNCVTISGELRALRVEIVVSADSTDLQAAMDPRPDAMGSLFIGGEVTEEMEKLLERLLQLGFRLRRRIRHKQSWHDKQMGRNPPPEASAKNLPTLEHGYLSLLLGQDEDRALRLDIAWGDGLSRLSAPGKTGD
jgi:hypothetical protein